MRRYVLAGRLRGVPIHIHWSLLALCALIVMASLGSLGYAVGAIVAVLAYFASMLVHEWGHVFFARRYGCAVYGIELYPLVGITRFQLPPTRLAHCAIAWGGVVFQAALGLPMVAWIKLVGYTPLEVVNAFMAMFGFLSIVMIVTNLMPIPPLDGATAWSIVPLLFRRATGRRQTRGWKPER
jgi:stage IV sporulation protein FB